MPEEENIKRPPQGQKVKSNKMKRRSIDPISKLNQISEAIEKLVAESFDLHFKNLQQNVKQKDEKPSISTPFSNGVLGKEFNLLLDQQTAIQKKINRLQRTIKELQKSTPKKKLDTEKSTKQNNEELEPEKSPVSSLFRLEPIADALDKLLDAILEYTNTRQGNIKQTGIKPQPKHPKAAETQKQTTTQPKQGIKSQDNIALLIEELRAEIDGFKKQLDALTKKINNLQKNIKPLKQEVAFKKPKASSTQKKTQDDKDKKALVQQKVRDAARQNVKGDNKHQQASAIVEFHGKGKLGLTKAAQKAATSTTPQIKKRETDLKNFLKPQISKIPVLKALRKKDKDKNKVLKVDEKLKQPKNKSFPKR